jgi:hypothetical protein
MMRSNVAARAAATAGLLGLVALSLTIASCASEESVKFGLPDAGTNPAGGATSTSGGACNVDPMCKVSFKTDIFAAIIDGPAGCTAAKLCHGGDTPQGDMILKPGDSHGAYVEFINYTLKKTATSPAGAYISPCDKMGSRLLCNTSISDGDNPYGVCGTVMPFGSAATKLTKQQLDTLAEWITCGAPEN